MNTKYALGICFVVVLKVNVCEIVTFPCSHGALLNTVLAFVGNRDFFAVEIIFAVVETVNHVVLLETISKCLISVKEEPCLRFIWFLMKTNLFCWT